MKINYLIYKNITEDYTIEKVIITEDSVTKGDEPIILRNPNKNPKRLTSSNLKNA